jgi:hypothetical protein
MPVNFDLPKSGQAWRALGCAWPTDLPDKRTPFQLRYLGFLL